MEQQRRSQQARHNLRPVDFPVEDVQLSAEMERPENEGNQAKDIKVDRARSVPPANENEQANKQIKQAHDSQVVFGREGFFGRRGEQGSLEFLAAAGKLIVYLGPKPSAVQPTRDLRGSC